MKIAGKRASISEIEQRLRAIDGVLDAAVTAVPVDGGRGNGYLGPPSWLRLWTSRPSASPQARFDPVVLPRRLRLVKDLGREATGKLTRPRLLALIEADSFAAPRYSSRL